MWPHKQQQDTQKSLQGFTWISLSSSQESEDYCCPLLEALIHVRQSLKLQSDSAELNAGLFPLPILGCPA